ncbi:MAG: hypothetical protein H0W72_12775 [Planctomycetes bacterium]|nr:hypothetical protein [Planctomycetota bacterium]
MRTLILTLAMLGLTVQAAEEAPVKPLPAPAKAALDKFARAEAKLKDQIVAERAKTIVELQKALKDTTKSGDLDGANAIKAEMDALTALNEADSDTDLLGNKKIDPAKLVIGTWAWNKTGGASGTFAFTDDGKITAQMGLLSVPGAWTVDAKQQIVITWLGDSARWERLSFDGSDKLVGDSFDAGPGGIKATRKK